MQLLIPLAVIFSFLIGSVIMIDAIWPNLYNINSWRDAPFHLIPLFLLPAWPWPVSFFISFSKETANSALFVALAGLLLVAAFHPVISKAPAEGKGFYVIIFVLLSWALFLVSLAFEEENDE